MSVISNRYRYFILLLSLICLSSISSNMSVFNFAIICLDNGSSAEMTNQNSTLQQKHTLAYSTQEQSVLMWAVGLGSMIGTFPFSWSYAKYGAKWVFTVAGFLSVVSTGISPLVIPWGLWWHAVVRFVQICSTIGWRFIYYIHALFGLLLFTAWVAFYTDFPSKSRLVSAKERELIERGKSEGQLKLNDDIPYWQICKNPLVLVIWLNAFVEIGTGVFLMSYTPLYLRNVHQYSVQMTGILSSGTTLYVIPVRICFGWVSDRIRFWSELTKMNIFNTCSLLGPAICYLVIGLSSSHDHILVLISIILIYTCYSTSGGGFYKCATYTCREYSQFVIATMQFIKCLTLFAAPAIYTLCVHDVRRQEEWRLIFFMMSGMLVVSGLLFLWISDDKPLPFTADQKYAAESDRSSFVFDGLKTQKTETT